MHKHVLGVIGYPMTHTLSPYLHGFMIEKLGLPASYFAFSVQPERLGDALAGAKALGLTGLNVTVPHKQAVMAHLDEIDARAKAIGAVNTIRFEKGAAFGTNTDAGGFLESLTFNNVSLAGREVLILGAGGAAHAIVYAAQQAGAAAISIFNRTAERAEKLAAHFGVRAVAEADTERLANGAVVINTTSVGMSPKLDACPLPENPFRSDLIYVDLVYNPLKTRFLALAQHAGATTVDGLGMLIFQGAQALSHWMAREIDVQKWYPELRTLLISKMK